jgi:copper chaperone CopZ
MKKLAGLMLVLALVAPARAAGDTVRVTIKGMVCSFCAQGIEKKLKKRPEVDKVEVNLEDKRVDLTLKKGKDIPDPELKKLITEAGYDVVEIKRGPEAP